MDKDTPNLSSVVRAGYAEALGITQDQVDQDDVDNVLHLLGVIGVTILEQAREVDGDDLRGSLKSLPNKLAKAKIITKLLAKVPSPTSSPDTVLDRAGIYSATAAAEGRVRVTNIIRAYFKQEEATNMLSKLDDDDFCNINRANHDASVVATTKQILQGKD